MQNFKELSVWKRAHQLVLRVYRVSREMPQSENFGLILNLRRSATHQATRIAEGAGRPADSEFAAELNRARAANHELEYLLLLSRDLHFLDCNLHDELAAEVIEVRKMISGLVKRLTAGS